MTIKTVTPPLASRLSEPFNVGYFVGCTADSRPLVISSSQPVITTREVPKVTNLLGCYTDSTHPTLPQSALPTTLHMDAAPATHHQSALPTQFLSYTAASSFQPSTEEFLLSNILLTNASISSRGPVEKQVPPSAASASKEYYQLARQGSSSQVMSYSDNERPLPLNPTDTETSQTTVCQDPFRQSSSQSTSYVTKKSSDTPTTLAPPPTSTYSSITYTRPFKITRSVRSLFEEAAMDYASVLRTALLFPTTPDPAATSSNITTTTVTTTQSCDTTLRTASHINKGSRWNLSKVQSSNGTTWPVMSNVQPSHAAPSTPLPPTWVAPRPWEQGDSIVRSIQEIRCQFDPVPPAATLRQPRPTTVTRTPPGVRVTKCVVAPWKENSPVSGKTRQVRPLFRGARGRDYHFRKTGLMQMEEDECIDVEEVSPPRTTYHLYRLGADGTKCALPLTVVSTEPVPKHPSAPDGSLQHHHITVSTPSQPHSAVTVSRHQLHAHPSGGQRQSSTHSNTRQNTESPRVCQPGTVHRQAVPALSPHQTRYDSNYSSFSVLKTPVAGEGQSGSNMNNVAQGHLRAASTQLATDGDVQVLSNTEGDKLLQCIIISSDSSPEVTENENEARTSAKALPEKEKSCRNSYLKHISKDTVSGRITDDLTKAAPPRDEVSKEVGIVPVSDDVDLPDLNRSPLPAAPGKLRAGEPEITDDPLTPDRAAAQDIDLSGASTIIFEDDLDADVTEKTKDINEGENSYSDETFCNNKITSVAGNTLAYRETMSNNELPENDYKKNDVPNFKLLQTSSDEVQSPTTIDVEEHEIVRQTDKRQDDKIHRRNVRKLQLVMSDFICICFIPGSVKPSKNSDTMDTHTQSNDNIRKQQFTKSEHKADIRIREENNLEIFEKPMGRQDHNIKLAKCMESVHVFEDNDVNHSGLRKDCVSTLKEVDILGDVSKDKAVDVAAPGIIPPEAINEIMELEKGITLREKSTDYCEFGDVSSSIFVSDGQLVFHIHVVSGSQSVCVDSLSAVEVGTIRQYGYTSGDDGCQGTGQGQQVGCESSGTQNDNLEMSVKEQISDLRNGEISIDENKSVMIKDTITTTTDDVTPTERNEIVKERDRPTLSEINEKSDLVCDIIKEKIRTQFNRDKNSKEPENFKESEKSKENSDPIIGRDAVESKQVKIFTQECSGLNDNNVVNKTPLVYLENKSNCNSYIENALTVTNIDINGNKSPRTSETPSADNSKKPILSHKEITKSRPLQMNVLKHHESLDSQMPLKSTLEKEEMLKSQKDTLEIRELPKLQNTQSFTMQSQDNPESLIPQNKLVDQAIPGSLCMVETKLIPTSRVVAETPESLETQGGEGNIVTRDSQPVQINTLKSLKILYGTSARGSVITRRDEQLDPGSASTDIHAKHILQQRYLYIMQGLVEELRLMGEREMKFIRDEERRTVMGSDKNDKASSADIILDGGEKVDDSKAIPEQSEHEAEGSEISTSKPRLSEADEEIGNKMNMIGNIDSNKECSCRENEEIAINQERTKENEREKELKFIREINVAHTEAPVTLKSNEIGNTNKLSFPCKQHDESASEDSEVTEFSVRKILSDSERTKWHKQTGSEARDESVNQAEVVNIECKVDEPENNEVKIIEVQEEIIISDDEDRTDGVDCYTRTTLCMSKLENSVTEGDDDSAGLGQTEKRDNSARDVNDRRISSDYRSKKIDECFEAMKEKSRKSSRKVAPGPSVQDEQVIENGNSNRKEEARENELSGLSKAHVTPNSPVCVAQSPKVVKRSSAITSPFPSVASISSISDFMKRISEKIDQLKVKTKSVKVDAGRHQQPVKRDFDSTLEDFISKHRQAEEGKQICYKATQSSGSRESERPNRCANDVTRYVDDVLRDEKDSDRCRISAVKCKEDTKCIDVKKYKRDAVGGAPASTSVTPHPSGPFLTSGIEPSTSNIQLPADLRASTNGVHQSAAGEKCSKPRKVSTHITHPSNNEHPSTHGAQCVGSGGQLLQGATESSGKGNIATSNTSSLNTGHSVIPTPSMDITTSSSTATCNSTVTTTTTNRATSSNSSTTNIGRVRKRRRDRGTTHHVLHVPLNELYKKCIDVVAAAGETLVESLRGQAVIGRNHRFSSLQPEHTRSLLYHLVRTRKGPYNPGDEEDKQYRRLLTLHGLVKAANLLYHYGLRPAIHSLQQFHLTHSILIPGCYSSVLTDLQELQKGSDLTHPKMKVLQEEMARITHSGDSSDAETKVLVVAKRETECLCEELRACLGSISVALLTGLQGYHQVLRVLESHSVVVWSEAEGGEALHHLPCSQFSLVVEWEGAGVPASACVQHCTRQNIPVISLTLTHLSGGTVEEEASSEEKRARIIPSVEEPQREAGGGASPPDTFTLVASTTVTNNAELHYILTSIYNINLVERCLRDVVLEEEEEEGGAAHAWPHLLLDERTSVLLQPLHQLRTDAHLHQLTCQMVLLSLQCTTCYIILYSHPPANSGYVFRSGVVKALARLVATCALFRSPDYTVSLLLAHNLHQVGEMVRKVGEATMAASPCWDKEEWTTRPWLTPHMSSHERFLLSLPCINSITAQVILTAMSLSEVLTLPLPALLSALPWIPEKVTTMLYKLLHRNDGAAVIDITSHDVGGRGGRSVTSSPLCVGKSVSVEPSVVEASEHPHPPGHPHSWQGDEDSGERTRGGYSGMLSVVDGRDHYTPDHIYEGDREGSSVGFPAYTEHGNNTLLPVYNTKSEYSDRLYSDCGSRAANDPHSLNTAVVSSEDRLSGDLFNARDYLTSVTSAAGTSLEYPQKMSPSQPISVVQPIPPTQHRPLLLSELEQYQPVLQLQQLMPGQSTTLQQQHQTTLPLPSPSHLCQQVSQTDQSAPLLQQSISQPCQPMLQPQQPVPQLQQSTSQMHADQHVHNYYQQNEEPLVVSPYFPDSQNYYCHQAGDQNKVAETHSQQQLHPNVASASKRVQTQYSNICLLSENGNQMVPLHSGEAQYNNIPAYRTHCGNIQQLQLQQEHEQQLLQKLQQQQQLQQQEHPQTQQENQQMQQQHKYWKESPSLHHHPLTPRLHGNKVLGVAKPYQWHGSGSMPVPPSPKVTLRQEGRGHDIPEEYDLAMSQVRGAGSSQFLSTQEVKKLIYRKVPGRGGQTQLAFKPI